MPPKKARVEGQSRIGPYHLVEVRGQRGLDFHGVRVPPVASYALVKDNTVIHFGHTYDESRDLADILIREVEVHPDYCEEREVLAMLVELLLSLDEARREIDRLTEELGNSIPPPYMGEDDE